MPDRIPVSAADLAAALEGQWVYAKNRDGTHHAQICATDDLTRDLWEKLAQHEPDGTVSVTMQRDDLLQVLGWASAHLPEGDWCPGHVTRFLLAAEKAVKPDAR